MYKILLGILFLCTGLCKITNAANIAYVIKTGQNSTTPVVSPPAGSDGALQKGQSLPASRFVVDVNNSDCITDKLTGLMWVRDVNMVNGGTELNWNDALSVAKDNHWCGYVDWRIPNVNELLSLVDYAFSNQANRLKYGTGNSSSPACDGVCFKNISENIYWSSSTYANTPTNAWGVSMVGGGTAFAHKVNNNYRLLPVRGGR